MGSRQGGKTMSNHCASTFPWEPDWEIVGLFAKTAMKACFGDAFELDAPLGGEVPEGRPKERWWEFACPQAELSTRVWKSGTRTIELRRDTSGLGAIGADFALEACAQAFGSASCHDEGIGRYALGSASLDQGRLRLATGRRWNGGPFHEHAKAHAVSYDWGMPPEVLEKVRGTMDRRFFEAGVDPEGSLSVLLAAHDADATHWLARMDWEGALAKHWGGAKPSSAKSAQSAALPFCALGLELPGWIGKELSQAGAERALKVALVWKNARAAKEVAKDHPEIDIGDCACWALKHIQKAHGNPGGYGANLTTQLKGDQEAARAARVGVAEIAEALELGKASKPAGNRQARAVKSKAL